MKKSPLAHAGWLLTFVLIAAFLAAMKRAIILTCLALTSCNTIQNQYVDATGKHGSGETTFSVTQTDGKFSIEDASGACRGAFDSWKEATVVFPISCTNGKHGSVTMTRPTANASIVAGEGTIQFVGGETKRFIFGPKS